MSVSNEQDNIHTVSNNDIVNGKMSICIPRVDISVNEEYIRKIFSEVLLNSNSSHSEETTDKVIEDIFEKIDLIIRKNEKGETYKRAFIHFQNWGLLKNRVAEIIWEKIHNGETVKIMHAKPSYWKCSLNRVPRPHQMNVGTVNADGNNGSTQSAYLVE